MMPCKKSLKLGVGATISVAHIYVHPSVHIREAFPNLKSGDPITNGLVCAVGKETVHKKFQDVVYFTTLSITSDLGCNIELYCIKRWCKVETEGDEDGFLVEEDGDVDDIVLGAQLNNN